MSKILNFGSLNIDFVYPVRHIVRPGETLQAGPRSEHPGGKGLNQSVAAARAGTGVLHAGNIGEDGGMLLELLRSAGADVSQIRTVSGPSGHAVIQVDESGQNSILVCPGANAAYTRDYILRVLDLAEPGDILLTQNETNEVPFLLEEAARRGIPAVLNPSPMSPEVLSWPLGAVRCFLLNETEGEALTGAREPEEILRSLYRLYPSAVSVLTLGERGALRMERGETVFVPAFHVPAADTTAAGDTWTGYYLSSRLAGSSPVRAMTCACAAAAIAVSRPGAAPSIPVMEEVLAFLREGAGT